jgi:fatty acid desaturase
VAEEQVQLQAVSPQEALAQELGLALADSVVVLVMLLALALVLGLVWWSVLPLALGFAVFRLVVAYWSAEQSTK